MEQELEIFNRRRRMEEDLNSQTLPSSPCHSFTSSSSSDFEFSISISPRKSSTADELFYKGHLLPLHLARPPRISMVRKLILSSSPTTSSFSSTDTSNTNSASRDSTGSRSSNDSQYSTNGDFLSFFPDCDSSRPSSITEDDEFKSFQYSAPIPQMDRFQTKKNNKYFLIPRFSSVFRKKVKNCDLDNLSGSGPPVKGMSDTVREVIRKYLKKVKPLYDKLLQQKQQQQKTNMGGGLRSESYISISFLETERTLGVQSESDESRTTRRKKCVGSGFSQSSSGHLRYPQREPCVSISCPSSMRSSPNHSGVLSPIGFSGGVMCRADSSSTEELQSAIQGAIAHCKNSMLLNKTVCDEI